MEKFLVPRGTDIDVYDSSTNCKGTLTTTKDAVYTEDEINFGIKAFFEHRKQPIPLEASRTAIDGWAILKLPRIVIVNRLEVAYFLIHYNQMKLWQELKN